MRKLGIPALTCILLLALCSAAKAARPTATYSVPVPVELEPYATFSISQVEVGRTRGKLVVRYMMPEELVGNNIRPTTLLEVAPGIEPGEIEMEGDRAYGTCKQDQTELVCNLRYSPRNDYIRAYTSLYWKYRGSEELPSRFAVARSFAADPIGILTIHLAGVLESGQ